MRPKRACPVNPRGPLACIRPTILQPPLACIRPAVLHPREVPDWWPALLLFVFATHAPFFAWRWWRTGEARFAATTLTFALLCLTYGLRVLAPELTLGGRPAHEPARAVALTSAVVSIGLLLLHLLGRRRA